MIPSPPQGVWEIGPFPLRAYALWIILGIVIAVWWGEKRWVARGGRAGVVLDTALWAIPFGLIGGRIYHVATDWYRYFGEGRNPVDALKIWDGGLGIWGAVAFGALGAYIGLRQQGIRALGALGDSIAPGVVLAQGIGRLGNYFNQELYGRETDVPWALEIYQRYDEAYGYSETIGRSTGQVLATVHPTFLYELLWNVLVAVALVLIDRRFRLGHGRLFALYVALYCFGRFWVELLRADAATEVFGLRINTIVSLVVMIAALLYFWRARRGREDPSELRAPGDPVDESVGDGPADAPPLAGR
ncbi:prolipoprotein diacylglyceryl transferase [Dietzia cinnamea]|uniref:prolipoprotein diacylglyceryl transferase n=1 Tax=Dietzia cinnamea TaxID=321318 RepID=UPI0021AF194E|nr:prolipoprotein diacylglyceryl transferase [Dietzia cinnamea]MCT2061766.1 prolipoprotein diacylglyceryl transferase [Dietzia cinnamea]MCT2235689.1 prolipoprotein diacylglyceryl transferase [Dietzia cinnamea]MCT2300085.1 prolipoprotein diacylglyceryl transferase [Dietzia cinnamea]